MGTPRYEYEFVRLGEGWLKVRKSALKEYKEVVHRYSSRGWRLVQVLAPGLGVYGCARFYELIFERPV